MKSASRFTGILCLTAFAHSLAIAAPDSRVIRVSKNASAYQSGVHYGTIQGALNSLGETSPTDEVVVLVYPGEYEENVTLNLRNVNLVGVGRESVLLTSDSETSATLAVAIQGTESSFHNVIEGLTIAASDFVPLTIEGSSSLDTTNEKDLIIRNCLISSSVAQPGILNQDGGGIYIDQSKVLGQPCIQSDSGGFDGLAMHVNQSELVLLPNDDDQVAFRCEDSVETWYQFSRLHFGADEDLGFSGYTAFSTPSSESVHYNLEDNFMAPSYAMGVDMQSFTALPTYDKRIGRLLIQGEHDAQLILDHKFSTGNPWLGFAQAGSRKSYIQHQDAEDRLALVSEAGDVSLTALDDVLLQATDDAIVQSTDKVILKTKEGAGYSDRLTIDAETGATTVNDASDASATFRVKTSAVLFDGTTGTAPASGTGTRLMWVPDKGALRAGKVTGDLWDSANIGTNSSVVGGESNKASGAKAIVGAGLSNIASGTESFVGSGTTNTAAGADSVVGGGSTNTTNASASYAFIGAGASNTANSSATYGVIVGGQSNASSATHSTVSGGKSNTASGTYSAAGGGESNTATATHTTVAGGKTNSSSGTYAAIGGGETNLASGDYAAIAGGYDNTADGDYGSAVGGYHNYATGAYSTVAGGYYNSAAADTSFVGGKYMGLTSAGTNSFVWGRSEYYPVNYTASNAFLIFPSGGSNGAGKAGVNTASPAAALHVVPQSGDEAFRIEHSQSGGDPFMSFYQGSTRRSYIQHANVGTPHELELHSEYGGLGFFTGSGGTQAEAMHLDSNRSLILRNAVTTPSAESGTAKFYVASGEMNVMDQGGSHNQFSSHFDPRDVDPAAQTSFGDSAVTIPYSIHHSNEFVGKGAVIDLTKLVKWAEQKMQVELGNAAGKLVYEYDLSPERTNTVSAYIEDSAAQELQTKMLATPWIEVPLGKDGELPTEAWEHIELMRQETQTVTEQVTEIDWNTHRIVVVEKEVSKLVPVPSGQFEDRLAENYKFEDGKLLRRSTEEDFATDSLTVPTLPDWVMDRIPTETRDEDVEVVPNGL